MFFIDGGEVFAGGVKRGEVAELLLFVGVSNSRRISSSKYYESKNGFCLFYDGGFCIQDGPNALREGVADPLAGDGLFQGVIWSWQARKTDHLLWIRERRFIIPLGASMISFESAGGAIAVCADHSCETKKDVDARRVRSVPGAGLSISVGGGAVAIGPGAVAAAGGVAIGGDAPSRRGEDD
jgi:hypothetical protein